MIALITSWIFILIIFSAAGNATILLYRKLTKEHEHYDILDTLLLGMCLLGVVVGITSLFIPSDFKLSLALLIISLICSPVMSSVFMLSGLKQQGVA